MSESRNDAVEGDEVNAGTEAAGGRGAMTGGAAEEAPAWFRAALQKAPERTFVDVEGCEIELLTWGQIGRPGILLHHGNGANADWWSFIAPLLADDFRVAAFSFSGMGRSGWRDAYSHALFAKESFRCAAAAGLYVGGARPTFVGHSFGGQQILYSAAAHPDQMNGLVLIDAGIPPKGSAWSRPAIRRKPPPVFSSQDEGLARFRLAPPQDCEKRYIVDHFATQGLRAYEAEGQQGWTWRGDPRLIEKMSFMELDALTGDITCPIASLWGENSVIFDADTRAHMSRIMPPQTVEMRLPGAGHHVLADQPLVVTCAVRCLAGANSRAARQRPMTDWAATSRSQ